MKAVRAQTLRAAGYDRTHQAMTKFTARVFDGARVTIVPAGTIETAEPDAVMWRRMALTSQMRRQFPNGRVRVFTQTI